MHKFIHGAPARIGSAVIALAVGFGGMLLAPSVSAATANQTYRIGELFPLSGPNAVYSTVFNKGVDLAIADVNKGGLIRGTLKLSSADSQALPEPAVIGMNKLVHVDRVGFVLSAFSGVSKAVAPIATRDHVITVNGGGVSPELAIGGYFINDIPLVNDEVKALWPYVVNELHERRIAVVHVDDPLGNGVNRTIHAECKQLKCSIVADISIDPTASSFQSEVVKVRASHPDAVYLASYGQQESVLTKQLRDGDVKAQLLSYSGYGLPSVAKSESAQGAIFTAEHLDFNANTRSKSFLEAYKKKYGNGTPNYYAVNYYNAVMIYADLIKYLQDHHESMTGPHMLDALHAIKTFDVVGGPLSFRKNGTVQMPIEINRIKNGTWTTLKVVRP